MAYYKGGGEWTHDPEQARSFEDIKDMRELAKYCRLQNAEAVEQFGNGAPDVHIPLEEAPSPWNRVNGEARAEAKPEGSGRVLARSKTTGELIEETERERDAAKFELLQAHRTINALRKQLRLLKAALPSRPLPTA